MSKKLLIPCLYLQAGRAVTGFGQRNLFGDGDVEKLARFYSDNGADELLVFDFSSGDEEHEHAIARIKEICAASEVPVMAAGNINRAEDVKKLIYAGCAKVVLNFAKDSNVELLGEVSRRFGREKMLVCISSSEEYNDHREQIHEFASGILALDAVPKMEETSSLPVILHTEERNTKALQELLSDPLVGGLSGSFISALELDLNEFKQTCKEAGIAVNTYESAISWSEFKLNSDGMVPVIVQDYKTDQVLMLAYMNEDAFNMTVKTGKMTYWSRSRQELWLKGETSGHFQYVKRLSIDCDNDTILAKVQQIGAACHTGNRSCFYREILKKDYHETNPAIVFDHLYKLIEDRKQHPKEGSYTNYLLEQGIDKILKKVGEEATEIIIAAKNPNPEEIKYEISDFLYHVMVLMSERGVTWDDITRELANR